MDTATYAAAAALPRSVIQRLKRPSGPEADFLPFIVGGSKIVVLAISSDGSVQRHLTALFEGGKLFKRC